MSKVAAKPRLTALYAGLTTLRQLTRSSCFLFSSSWRLL